MNFGQTIEELKSGKKVSRVGWNGKNMFLVLIQPYEYNPSNEHIIAGLDKSAWICLKTADSKVVPWQPSQTDMLAEDWNVIL